MIGGGQTEMSTDTPTCPGKGRVNDIKVYHCLLLLFLLIDDVRFSHGPLQETEHVSIK